MITKTTINDKKMKEDKTHIPNYITQLEAQVSTHLANLDFKSLKTLQNTIIDLILEAQITHNFHEEDVLIKILMSILKHQARIERKIELTTLYLFLGVTSCIKFNKN